MTIHDVDGFDSHFYESKALQMLKDNCNFKTQDTMKNVQKILQLVNKTASKFFLKISENCPTCKETMKDPVQLPCQHIVCLQCLQDLWENEDRQCPECKQEYPQDFELATMADKR